MSRQPETRAQPCDAPPRCKQALLTFVGLPGLPHPSGSNGRTHLRGHRAAPDNLHRDRRQDRRRSGPGDRLPRGSARGVCRRSSRLRRSQSGHLVDGLPLLDGARRAERPSHRRRRAGARSLTEGLHRLRARGRGDRRVGDRRLIQDRKGQEQEVWNARDRKLEVARASRRQRRQAQSPLRCSGSGNAAGTELE